VRVLHDQLLCPFHVRHVQAQQPPLDYERRKALCEWLLRRDASSPLFLNRVLLMDKPCFPRNGILNAHNQHTLADEIHIPFKKHDSSAVNVWTAIVGDLHLGPYELPPRLSEPSHLQFFFWRITTTTGWRTIDNAADNTGTAWWGSCPLFLWSHAIYRQPLPRLMHRMKRTSYMAPAITQSHFFVFLFVGPSEDHRLRPTI
jgi:hypothetical protein